MAASTLGDAIIFEGRWVGETQGLAMPAHLWEVTRRGRRLQIETRWENDTHITRMYAELLPDEPGFTLGHFQATLLDPHHFVIAGWDTNDTRGGTGPDYDVIFSRPGVAELSARAVWRRYRAGLG